MEAFSEFVEGPLLWLAWAVFIAGSIIRLIMFFSLSRKRDKPVYEHFNWGYVIKTWFRYIFPFNQTVANSPVFTLLSYVFHLLLVIIPLFIFAHLAYWSEETVFAWDFMDWGLPDEWVPWLTWVFIGIGAFFLARRIFAPEVRIISQLSDYLLLIATVLPFLTGFLTAQTDFLSDYMRVIHIMSGELMMFLIPFTKLSHFVLFFPSRMVMGIEWGRRGYSA